MGRKDGDARREAILDAALTCFMKRGVFATGIEDIRAEAKASPSSVYHLFSGGQADVTAALLERIFDRLFAELAVKTAGAPSAQVLVERLVRAHLDWVFDHEREARVMYETVGLRLPAALQARVVKRKREAMRPLLAEVEPFIRSRALPKWEPEVFDVVLLGASHEACRRWLLGAEFSPAWLRKNLPALAWSSLRRSA
jgi:AcrR family transcriptional regulator